MNVRARIAVGIKLTVSAVLIYLILRGADFRQIWATIISADLSMLLVAYLVFLVGYLITAVRWRLLLAAQGVVAPLGYLVRSFMVAIFFSHFLPSTVGGDAVRVYDSWRLGKNKSRAVSVIFVDRLLGVSALALLAVLGVFFAAPLTERLPSLTFWVVAVAFATTALAYLIFRPPAKLLSYCSGSQLAVPGMFRRLLGRIADVLADAFILFKDRHDVLWRAMLLSFALQVSIIVYFYFLAVALGFDVPFFAFFLLIPVATVIMMLPISINGIGVREGIFALLFVAYGIGSDAAIAFAWLSYGFLLFQGLLGGLIFALRKESTGTADSSPEVIGT